ncbi:helix-turn-helix transcriptional regulator [Mycobacterium sp. NPDC051804]|uniref:helix-turn-helix transcriptional regulator n=1 Tax=Mycobacterium sp. NPDC051804 TaxID=3364295 RepID=UPI0037ACDA8C
MAETTSRVLQLLGLLQSRRVWTGEELADRLGVTTRSVRRDVDRLRDLGYPVHASKGHGGGYQLGAGAALPPLLLDPDEAVAMAVCLRLAAGGTVAGVGESALRALSKLDQVMPARLRSQVAAVHDATVTLTSPSSDDAVEPDVLMTLARACRDREHVNCGYVDIRGKATQRRLEPYQLVTTGRRWYLLAYDRDKQDWRSLRLDRMADVRALGSTFVARDAPDAAKYVQRSISSSPYRYVARVRFNAPEEALAQHFSPASVTIEADGPNACIVTTGADDPERMIFYFATVGHDFEVLEPPEVVRAVDAVAQRLRRAAGLDSLPAGDPTVGA